MQLSYPPRPQRRPTTNNKLLFAPSAAIRLLFKSGNRTNTIVISNCIIIYGQQGLNIYLKIIYEFLSKITPAIVHLGDWQLWPFCNLIPPQGPTFERPKREPQRVVSVAVMSKWQLMGMKTGGREKGNDDLPMITLLTGKTF